MTRTLWWHYPALTMEAPTFQGRLQDASEELDETYAQHEACFMLACEDMSPDLPVMVRGVGWLWWG